MVRAIHLPGIGAGLILRMDEDSRGWCRCFVRDGGEHLHALENPLAHPAGEFEGQTVSWVMTLASPHASIYSALIGQDQWLFIENANGEISNKIRLTLTLRSEIRASLVMENTL